MTGVQAKMIEQRLVALLREAAQAHFLRTPASHEKLVALLTQCNQLHTWLRADQALPEQIQSRLDAEVAWIEGALARLQSRQYTSRDTL